MRDMRPLQYRRHVFRVDVGRWHYCRGGRAEAVPTSSLSRCLVAGFVAVMLLLIFDVFVGADSGWLSLPIVCCWCFCCCWQWLPSCLGSLMWAGSSVVVLVIFCRSLPPIIRILSACVAEVGAACVCLLGLVLSVFSVCCCLAKLLCLVLCCQFSLSVDV